MNLKKQVIGYLRRELFGDSVHEYEGQIVRIRYRRSGDKSTTDDMIGIFQGYDGNFLTLRPWQEIPVPKHARAVDATIENVLEDAMRGIGATRILNRDAIHTIDHA